MNVGEYRVALISEADPLSEGVEVHVFLNRGDGVYALAPDGKWDKTTEGSPHRPPALRLPSGAIEALTDAVDRLRGAPSHARTEAAVLREWLGVERKRVDDLMSYALPLKIVDMGDPRGPLMMPTGAALKASSPLSRKP